MHYDLLVDELSKTNRQNSDYRSLIMDNEEKLQLVQKEIVDLQKNIQASRSHI